MYVESSTQWKRDAETIFNIVERWDGLLPLVMLKEACERMQSLHRGFNPVEDEWKYLAVRYQGLFERLLQAVPPEVAGKQAAKIAAEHGLPSAHEDTP